MKREMALSYEEKITSGLRELYSAYGYKQYKMLKFEEYELYVRNKDFLVSDNIVTFTNSNGSLMALKPDVTLSIVKNYKEEKGELRKVYYSENVYRNKGLMGIGEISQTGLECMGDIDDYTVMEVLSMAVESLKTISDDYMLDVSHLGIVSKLLDKAEVSEENREEAIKYIGDKSPHGFDMMKDSGKISAEGADLMKTLISTGGAPDKVREMLWDVLTDESERMILDNFIKVINNVSEVMETDRIRVDFSVVNNIKYYSGIVFNGFIYGMPSKVLSGGQYDNLMKKMKKKSSAIGFAVYLDGIGNINDVSEKYDIDVLILYDEKADTRELLKTAKSISESGRSVTVKKQVPERYRYKELIRFDGKEAKVLENND